MVQRIRRKKERGKSFRKDRKLLIYWQLVMVRRDSTVYQGSVLRSWLPHFCVFMEEFRRQLKVMHPENKSNVAIGTLGEEKRKSMSDKEKAPFVRLARYWWIVRSVCFLWFLEGVLGLDFAFFFFLLFFFFFVQGLCPLSSSMFFNSIPSFLLIKKKGG